MTTKNKIMTHPLMVMGLLLMLTLSCEKDKDEVPVLITNEVSDIIQSTATCGGNITSDGGSTITARGVCWGTEQTPTVTCSKTTDGKGIGSFTSAMTGLNPNATYYVRAYATNSIGTGYGNEITFTMPALYTLSDIVGHWSGKASNAQNSINLNLTISATGKVTGSGVNSTWSINGDGKITGGGSFSFISGSHFIVAGASWTLQLFKEDQKITGIFDVSYSSLHSMNVVLTKN